MQRSSFVVLAARELRRNGFRFEAQQKDFLRPITLHRWLNRTRLTSGIEAAFAGLGLTALFGSPVTIRSVPVEARGSSSCSVPHPACDRGQQRRCKRATSPWSSRRGCGLVVRIR